MGQGRFKYNIGRLLVGLVMATASSGTLILISGSSATVSADELDSGLSILSGAYLFPKELEADRLLGRSLSYAAAQVPELTARPLGDRGWELYSPRCSIEIELPPKADVKDMVRPLSAAGRFIENCVDDLPEKVLPPRALLLQGVLSALDPYSTVLDGRNRTEHSIQFKGRLAGIGARVGIRDDSLTLIQVYKDSPAYKAGLRDDDIVRRIDDLSAVNILVGDAVERIRGPEGSRVTLLIQRSGLSEPLSIVVTRGIVMIPSVTAELLGDDIIYSEISQFSQTTPKDFRHHIAQIVDSHPFQLKGIVVDLRSNPGGSMLGSAAIGDMFLDHGVLIKTSGRGGRRAPGLTSEIDATDDTPFADLPVAFLSGPRTASGSELLAAALRNNDRAILVGDISFGKGTIQRTFGIAQHSTLKITVGHFLPNGRPIPGGGLIPDVEVRSFHVADGSVVPPFEKETMDLPFWLQYPSWAKSGPTAATVTIYNVDSETEESKESKATEAGTPKPNIKEGPDLIHDHTLALAAELLRRFGDTSRTRFLRESSDYLSRQAADSDSKLVSFLSARGVDWAKGKRSDGAFESLSFQVIPKQPASAGRESEVEITLTNNGSTPLYRLRTRVVSSIGGLGGQRIVFGKIDAGASVTKTIPIKPSVSRRLSRSEVSLIVFDDEGQVGKLEPTTMVVAGGPRPDLAVRYLVTQKDDGTTQIKVEVANRGDGAAKVIRGRLENPLSENFEIVDGVAVIDKLEAGEDADFTFSLRPLADAGRDSSVHLLLGEGSFGTFIDPQVRLFGHDGYSAWLAPPRIEVLGTRENNDGTSDLVFQVSDPDGISAAWVSDGRSKTDYVAPSGADATTLRLHSPFHPAERLSKLLVTARDKDGLISYLRTDL